MATYSEYLEFFRRHRNETSSSKTLAYALLFKKTGSGYSTVGTKKLIDSEGESVGLISGGCLEPEIVLHAQEVIRSGVSKKIILNTRSPEDRFFGSGAGCEGELSIFIDLLPLNIKEGDLLLHFLGVEKPGFLVHDFAAYSPLQRHRYTPHFSTPDDFNEDLFVEETKPVPNALIVGAHPDSLALYQLTQFLGWRSSVIDFRSSLIEHPMWLDAPCLHRLEDSLEVSRFSCAFIMSHNYEYDLGILNKLLEGSLKFIGLLGPQKRKQKLFEDLKTIYNREPSPHQSNTIFGPVGLPVMGKNPREIALSMVHHCQFILEENTIKTIGASPSMTRVKDFVL